MRAYLVSQYSLGDDRWVKEDDDGVFYANQTVDKIAESWYRVGHIDEIETSAMAWSESEFEG